MATVEVSTWAELVSAVTTAAGSNAWTSTTVKLIADIDLNDTNPSGVCCQISFASDAIKYKTAGLIIDGGYTDPVTGEEKRHVIKNARTDITNPRPIFYLTDILVYERWGKHISFKNLDFQNLILADQPFVWIRTDNIQIEIASRTPWQVDLDNCRFVGSRTGAYLFFSNAYLNCNRCYFDMRWIGAGQTNLAYTSLIPKDGDNATSAVANYCRFKESYGGWTWPSDLAYNSTDRFFTCSFFKMSGCRIEGKTQIPGCNRAAGGNNGGYYFPIISKGNASYVPAMQNVFDVSLTAVRNSGVYDIDTVLYSTFTGVVNKNVKYDGTDVTTFTDNRAGFDGGTTTAPILATPAQMKDAEWLSNNGFNIVVPSE